MKAVGLMLLCAAAVALNWLAAPVEAFPPFKKAFDDKYVKDSDNEGLKAAFKTASCNTCHVKGSEKTVRNPYGEALAKITGGKVKADMDAAKANGGQPAMKAVLDAALKKLEDGGFDQAAKEPSPSGPSFGDVIKSGKLPASK